MEQERMSCLDHVVLGALLIQTDGIKYRQRRETKD